MALIRSQAAMHMPQSKAWSGASNRPYSIHFEPLAFEAQA